MKRTSEGAVSDNCPFHEGGIGMNAPKTIVPRAESEKLLALPTRQAEQLFQSYERQQQLEILSATRNPKSREKLYYLVPDCTELIQESPTEEVLQVMDTMLGTGLTSVLLPCLSNAQFEELLDIAIWRDGQLDPESLDLWIFELSECEPEELGRFLRELDVRLLAALLYGRVTFKDEFAAMLLESGYIDPSAEAIVYTDERARAICNAIWQGDGEVFYRFLGELLVMDEEVDVEAELAAVFGDVQADRAERVAARDKAAGIDVTEIELVTEVDLETLTFDDDGDDTEGDDDDTDA